MLSYQFIKKINETEVGNTGTNETYILVPKRIDVLDIFAIVDFEYKFKYKRTNKIYKLRLTIGREQRIVGLGPFYRENNVRAGSRVLIEFRKYEDGKIEHFIDVVLNDNSLMLQVSSSHGFRVLNNGEHKLLEESNFKINQNGELYKMKLQFVGNYAPRKDSKNKFDYYDLLINDKSKKGYYSNGDIIEINCNNEICNIIQDISYQKIIVEGMNI